MMTAFSLHAPFLSLCAHLLLLPVCNPRRTVDLVCGNFSSMSSSNDVSKKVTAAVHVLLHHPAMNGDKLDLVNGLQYQLTISSGDNTSTIRGLALIVTSEGEDPSPTDLTSTTSSARSCAEAVGSTSRAPDLATPSSATSSVYSPQLSRGPSSSTETSPESSSAVPVSSASVQSLSSTSPFFASSSETTEPSRSSSVNSSSTAVEQATQASGDAPLCLPMTLTWTADVTTSSSCVRMTVVIMMNDSAWTQTTRDLCKPTGCKEYFTEDSGSIASPNFPSQYPDGNQCTYIISPLSSRFIVLQFQAFLLEQAYSQKCMDWLTVSNATNSTERLCGTADFSQLRQMNYVTTDNLLVIQFVTDNKISAEGFQAIYATDRAKVCDSDVTDLNGTLFSPRRQATGTYLPNMHCTTTLSVPPSYRIRVYLRKLNFSDLDTGACSEGDFLQFRDLQSEVRVKVTCSSGPHREGQVLFESSSSRIEVKFESDHALQGEGFELYHVAVASCQNETYSQRAGSVVSVNFPRRYPNMQECFYTINVTDDSDSDENVIELTFPAFFTESDTTGDARLRDGSCTRDFVEIFDGEDRHKVCGNWTGKEHLLLFRSHSNVIVFRFVSDEQITRPGFYATWQTVKGNNKTCLSTWIDTGYLCFQVVYGPQTWEDGETDCISRGGHLAAVLDNETQQLINSHILSQHCTDWDAFWIGGNDREWESDFYWTDGSKVTFTNWFPGFPLADQSGLLYGRQPSDDGTSDEDCTEMRQRFSLPDKGQTVTSTLYWNDRSCERKNPYVCQIFPKAASPKAVECNKSITLTYETPWVRLQSPDYPRLYPDRTNCTYFIRGPLTAELELEFWDFWLENESSKSPLRCDYDFLEVSRSPTSGDTFPPNKLCGDWSGRTKLLRQVVTSFYAFIHFSTDHSKSYRGFDLTVRLRNGSSGCNEAFWVRGSAGCVRMVEDGADWQAANTRCKQFSASLWKPPTPEDAAAVVTRYLAGHTDNRNVTLWLEDKANLDNSCLAMSPLRYVIVTNVTLVTETTTSWTLCSTRLPFVCQKPVQNVSESLSTRYIYANASEGTIRPRLSDDGHNYTNDDATKWIVEGPQGVRMLLRVTNVALEEQGDCLYDWLVTANTTHDRRVCGRQNETVALSTANVAEVSFHSDYSITGPAFSLFWQVLNMSLCQLAVLTKSRQNFTSFNFPRPFPDAIDCLTRINVASGSRVKMAFDEIRFLATHENSVQVNVGQGWVKDVGDSASSKVARRMFVSSDNVMEVRFNRFAVSEGEGFTGWYEEVTPSKSGDPLQLTSTPVWLQGADVVTVVSVNFPLPYPDNILQDLVVRAAIGYRVRISLRHVNLGDCEDKLEIVDVSLGESEQAETILSVCGGEPFEDETESKLNRVRVRLAAASRAKKRRKRATQNDGGAPKGFNISLRAVPDPTYLNTTATLLNVTFDSCAEKPCQHNGTCVQLSDVTARCLCPPSQAGLFCQITWCELHVCEHGDCQTIGSEPGFACQCMAGFWGARCHMDDATCRRDRCSSRGKCVGNASQSSCQCDGSGINPFCAAQSTDGAKTPGKSIGERLLGEPIWIGLIAILTLLVLFGAMCMIRHRCAKKYACCRIQFKGKELPDENKAQESHTLATFGVTRPKLLRPPPLSVPSQTPMPTISITKAEDETVPHSPLPKPTELKAAAAARLFASYREAERTPISAPVLTDFSTTTDTFMAQESDDTSMGTIVDGQFLLDLHRRERQETRSLSSLRGIAQEGTSLLARDKVRRVHSTGPFPLRQESRPQHHMLPRSPPKARSLDERDVSPPSPSWAASLQHTEGQCSQSGKPKAPRHGGSDDRRSKDRMSEHHLFPEVIVCTGLRREEGDTSEASMAGTPTASRRRRKSLRAQKSVEYDPADDPTYHMTQVSSDPGFCETYSEPSLTFCDAQRGHSAAKETPLNCSHEWTSAPSVLVHGSVRKTLKHELLRLSTSSTTLARAERTDSQASRQDRNRKTFKHQETVDSYFGGSRKHRHLSEPRGEARGDSRRGNSSTQVSDDVWRQGHGGQVQVHGQGQGRPGKERREKFQRGQTTLDAPTYMKKPRNGDQPQSKVRTLRKYASVDIAEQHVLQAPVRARSEDVLEARTWQDFKDHSSRSKRHKNHAMHRHGKTRSKDRHSRDQRIREHKVRARDLYSKDKAVSYHQSFLSFSGSSQSSLTYEPSQLSKHARSWHSHSLSVDRLEQELTPSKDSSTESEQSCQRRSQQDVARRDASLQRHHRLDALGSSASDKDVDFTKKELFRKFFSQEVDLTDALSNEEPRFFSDSWTNSVDSSVSTRKNSLKFFEHNSGDSAETLHVVMGDHVSASNVDGSSNDFLAACETTPKCSVIVYVSDGRTARKNRSRAVSKDASPSRSPSERSGRDSLAGLRDSTSAAPAASPRVFAAGAAAGGVHDAELSSGSSESVRTKGSEGSFHLSVTDTDSAVSSAASRQTTPSACRPLAASPAVSAVHAQLGKKYSDSAYQTKESSVDVFDDPRRRSGASNLKGEDKKVTQRLHQAAVKLFVLQQRVRKGRLSRDSAVHTISEDEAAADRDNDDDMAFCYDTSHSRTGRRLAAMPEKLSTKKIETRHHGITEEEEHETECDLGVKDMPFTPVKVPLSDRHSEAVHFEEISETVEV